MNPNAYQFQPSWVDGNSSGQQSTDGLVSSSSGGYPQRVMQNPPAMLNDGNDYHTYEGSAYYGAGEQYAGAYGGEYGNYNMMMTQGSYDATTAAAAAQVEIGALYPHPTLPMLAPQLFGAPVTAIAVDPTSEAVFAASDTQQLGKHHQSQRIPGQASYTNRGAMLATHRLGDGSLYASVAGHPEASSTVLKQIYASIYGHSQNNNNTSNNTARQTSSRIPSHAYRPSYGYNTSASPTPFQYHMGIQDLVALPGYVASVSPGGVRLHTDGGFQVADWDIQGMISATIQPLGAAGVHVGSATHMTVGGTPISTDTTESNRSPRRSALYTVDLYQGLRVVGSSSLSDTQGTTSVTSLATSHSKGSIVAGCSDGYIRMFDGRRLRSLAKVKSHAGGVVRVAVSNDGNLVATTGYGSKSSSDGLALYAFPDPTVYVHDIRYLGRGGFPHPFAGVRGGPRFLSFLPDLQEFGEEQRNRVVVCSGQSGGGMQIITPYQETSTANAFLIPQLDRSEVISCDYVFADDGTMAIGTSRGRILQYQLSGTITAKSAKSIPNANAPVFNPRDSQKEGDRPRKALELMSQDPRPPQVSLQASLLQSQDPSLRTGANDMSRSIVSTFTVLANPVLSTIGDPRDESKTSFGPLATGPRVAPARLNISPALLDKVSHTVDFLQTVPANEVEVDLLSDKHAPKKAAGKNSRRKKPLQPNPNKLLYSKKLAAIAYQNTYNRRSQRRGDVRGALVTGDDDDEDGMTVPSRYGVLLRPTHKSVSLFLHSDHNRTGLVPGWDYPPTMPNTFVSPVLMLFYCIPEIRSFSLESASLRQATKDKGLLPELSMLFYRIENISAFSLIFASDGGSDMVRVGAWSPSAFIAYLMTMPEAEQLQILDGCPEAVETPRRPEAFYRFLSYQLDKEIGNKSNQSRLLDSLTGISFTSVSEFLSNSAPPTTSSTRALSLDLVYDSFLSHSPKTESEDEVINPRFCDVLQDSLFREKKLPGWNQRTKTNETILQRKIATSLPSLLTLTCACAGRKESDGLSLWRSMKDDVHWLPEHIEIELKDDGAVMVRELVVDPKTGSEVWVDSRSERSIPALVSDIMRKSRKPSQPGKVRYALEAVVSLVRDDLDRNCPEELKSDDENPCGHHILHVKIPNVRKKELYRKQLNELEQVLFANEVENVTDFTVLGLSTSRETIEKRLSSVKTKLEKLEGEVPAHHSWVLINGFAVNETVVEDARAFHIKFKEPCLVLFRALEGNALSDDRSEVRTMKRLSNDVWRSQSITNGLLSQFAQQQLPGHGDLVAFDAEFVSVQDDYSTLSETGSKLTIRETRHAVARISLLDCRSDSERPLLDDYVLPREPVVDYLTRFSGIVAADLDPDKSPHHLVTPRSAYLKLRLLQERGCIFVGHGLLQDFWNMNLVVPASQIVDTIELYHKPAQRYISLRFLANFVLQRDMQQDVHDSMEDALAAYELYRRAVELKREGKFEKFLEDLYAYGQKMDWKLGLDEDNEYS